MQKIIMHHRRWGPFSGRTVSHSRWLPLPPLNSLYGLMDQNNSKPAFERAPAIVVPLLGVPRFTIISGYYFRNDMRDGRRKYCNPLLVNAILAVACRLSDRKELQNDSNSRTAGDDFFKEAKDLLARNSTPDVTTVQALGIMSSRELSFGREDTGWMLMGRCAQMAMYLGLHLPAPALTASLCPRRSLKFVQSHFGASSPSTSTSVHYRVVPDESNSPLGAWPNALGAVHDCPTA